MGMWMKRFHFHDNFKQSHLFPIWFLWLCTHRWCAKVKSNIILKFEGTNYQAPKFCKGWDLVCVCVCDLTNVKNASQSQSIYCPDLFLFHWKKQEREHYEYLIAGGTLVHKQTGDLLNTSRDVHDSKWIFVMSTSKRLYAGKARISLA